MKKITYIFKKINPALNRAYIIIFFLLFVSFSGQPLFSAELDDFYPPFLTKDKLLYKAGMYFYRMDEKGKSGKAAFDAFDADPDIFSLNHSLRFSLTHTIDLELAYGQAFPSHYKRLTYGSTGDLSAIQQFNLDYFQDYSLKLRHRKGHVELYAEVLEKRQRSNWNYATVPDSPSYFNYIKAHYEDIKIGTRYLSGGHSFRPESNLSGLSRSFLSDNQINLEAELGFKNGRLKRTASYYLASTWNYNYLHQLRPHFIPRIILRYGLKDNLELKSGLSYTTPFKYNYEYKRFNPSGTTNYITGTYQFKNSFSVPIKLSYRPKDNLEVMFASDYNFISQRLDYWEKKTDDSITTYPARELNYYNIKPTFKLTYLNDAGKEMGEDEFSSLTKKLLLGDQFLITLQYQKDISILKKDMNNGAQNIIDPYNVFFYPVDLFVVGTEYGLFSAGNDSAISANVLPQNFYQLNTAIVYGLKDSLNIGVEAGYVSGVTLHNFILKDMDNRFYRVEPYYYFNFLTDWQVTENSLLSFKAHFIPQYKTFLDSALQPQQFEATNNYIETALTCSIFF